ncbi:MAG: P1 family peptidase [Alphaproteobacteria bacterium]|nr:P1 family peptidase [Alphaproteobacteria bacterium]
MTTLAVTVGHDNSLRDIAKAAGAHASVGVGHVGRVSALVFSRPALAACAVLGGAPATRETELLRVENTVSTVDGLVLSGGSVFGLAAADGAVRFLAEQGRGFVTPAGAVPIIPAASVYDLRAPFSVSAKPSSSDGSPPSLPIDVDFRHMGYVATADAWEQIHGRVMREAEDGVGGAGDVGGVGAGSSTRAADCRSGIGTASFRVRWGKADHHIAALVVANPFGGYFAPGGFPWAHALLYPEDNRDWRKVRKTPPAQLFGGEACAAPPLMTNTVLAAVVTDAPLPVSDLQRLALCAGDGIARAVRPSHTPYDGDIVFAVSCPVEQGTASTAPAAEDTIDLGIWCGVAADVVTRAMIRAIIE